MSITVAISSYKYGHLLSQAIDSVLSQTLLPDKILVVDDCGGDNTSEIANRYGIECIKRTKNLGVVDNFNDILFNHVNTEKLMFLGADNWLRPDALEKMNLDYDIVSCHMYLTGNAVHNLKLQENDKYYYKDGYWIRKLKNYNDFKWKLNRSNVLHGSSLYNTKIAREIGGYKAMPTKNGKTCEDWHLWREMSKAGARCYNVQEPLIYCRKHNDNFNGVYK